MRYVLARIGQRGKTKRMKKLLLKEKRLKLNNIQSCYKFKKACFKSRENFRSKILNLKKRGKKIAGYAASAKSSTVLNFCKINYKHIDYIADSTKEKIGKYTPGSHIPIVPINYFRKIISLCNFAFLEPQKRNSEKRNEIYKFRWKVVPYISEKIVVCLW